MGNRCSVFDLEKGEINREQIVLICRKCGTELESADQRHLCIRALEDEMCDLCKTKFIRIVMFGELGYCVRCIHDALHALRWPHGSYDGEGKELCAEEFKGWR